MRPSEQELNVITQLFEQAQALLQSGEAESAETVCAGALDRYPDDVNLLCVSARALIKLGHFDRAGRRIHHALSVYPDFARTHEVKGELFLAKKEFGAAAEALQQALNLDPDRQQARVKLGRVLMRMGRTDEALALTDEIMESSEDNKDIARASELEKAGKQEEAETIYRQILTRHPDNVSAMRLWARLGIERERYADAEVLLLQAVKLAPGFSRAWGDLCTVQYEQEKYEEAIESASQLVKLEPRVPDGHIWLGSAIASTGRHREAIKSYDDALEIVPDHVVALCAKGNALRTIGDQENSIAAFRRCLEGNPLHAEAYWSLANLKTFRFEDSEIEDILALLGDERIPAEGQVQLNNALGLEFEGRKDYDRAFEFIDRGNVLRREQEFYDRVENEEMVQRSIEAFSQEFIDDNSGHGDPDPAPIFIVGLPRSGSTLLEQILASHSQVDGTYELRDLALTIRSKPKLSARGNRYPTSIANIDTDAFKRLGNEYIKRTQRHRDGRPFFTDKNPNNFVHVGLLHLILPNAKIIDARRHPLDSCFGGYKQLFARGQPFTYDLAEIGDYYLQYRRLMEHWQEVLPGKVLDVHYEHVVADLESQVGRILEHCGLEWEDACVNFHETSRAVKSASSEQVRTPIYTGAVNTWKRYEKHLDALIDVLEPVLTVLPKGDRPARFSG